MFWNHTFTHPIWLKALVSLSVQGRGWAEIAMVGESSGTNEGTNDNLESAVLRQSE